MLATPDESDFAASAVGVEVEWVPIRHWAAIMLGQANMGLWQGKLHAGAKERRTVDFAVVPPHPNWHLKVSRAAEGVRRFHVHQIPCL